MADLFVGARNCRSVGKQTPVVVLVLVVVLFPQRVILKLQRSQFKGLSLITMSTINFVAKKSIYIRNI